MSRARLVITAVVVEGRPVGEVAAAYGVHRSWVYRLLARYEAEGQGAFQARSRRPHTNPRATPAPVVEAIVNLRTDLAGAGLDAGAHTIAWHLATHHGVVVSAATVHRHLVKAGLVTPSPRKRPRSSYVRFAAEMPNQLWQADFTHVALADGTDTEVLAFIDDHSRLVLAITAHRRVTGADVVATFRTAITTHGVPAAVLTDNGMVFTTRFAGGRGGRNAFEHELVRLGVEQRHSRPAHPTTCGKVERLWQTMKKWLTGHDPATTIDQLQTRLDTWAQEYNHQRPHRSLNRSTPAATYATRPKATPNGTTAGTHERVRHDRVDDAGSITLRHAGRLHHIGIGRAHAHTPVIVLVQDLNIRVVAALTGELIRELVLDPTRNYQPHKQRQPKP